MFIGLVGKKIGMTRVFSEDGSSAPVTVVDVSENRVLGFKSEDKNGYSAVMVAYGVLENNSRRSNKSYNGVFLSKDLPVAESIIEFRLDSSSLEKFSEEFSVGDVVPAGIFKNNQLVDVSAKSKGKGFSGVVKRWNFATQDNSHGNSLSHRAPGSIGQCQTPGRVFKGKKMAGQYGAVRKTIQSLKIISVNESKGILLISGGIPGSAGGLVVVKSAVKSKEVCLEGAA